jgi:hypothetical protein
VARKLNALVEVGGLNGINVHIHGVGIVASNL